MQPVSRDKQISIAHHKVPESLGDETAGTAEGVARKSNIVAGKHPSKMQGQGRSKELADSTHAAASQPSKGTLARMLDAIKNTIKSIIATVFRTTSNDIKNINNPSKNIERPKLSPEQKLAILKETLEEKRAELRDIKDKIKKEEYAMENLDPYGWNVNMSYEEAREHSNTEFDRLRTLKDTVQSEIDSISDQISKQEAKIEKPRLQNETTNKEI